MHTLNKILLLLMLSIGNINSLYSQDSFILNYEDVDIKKVTQDIAQFSKKTMETTNKETKEKKRQLYKSIKAEAKQKEDSNLETTK